MGLPFRSVPFFVFAELDELYQWDMPRANPVPVGAMVVSSMSRSYSVLSSSRSVLVLFGLPVKNLLVTKSFNHVAKALHCCLNTETVGSSSFTASYGATVGLFIASFM